MHASTQPEERKILGSQLDRAMAVQRSRSVILEYQASPAKQQEPLADYDEVSALATNMQMCVCGNFVSTHECVWEPGL